MKWFTMIVLMLFALFLGGVLATEDEACTALAEDGADMAGGALLQKSRQKSSLEGFPFLSLVSRESGQTQPFQENSPSRGSLGASYQGAPTCVSNEVTSAQVKTQALLGASASNTALRRSSGGADASLDATGFRQTTSLCCPVEMEKFFTRLLDSLGYEICSLPHVQGLMHWFTCVPELDFQYVLDIIAIGNPCKYWAPKGQACPTLSAECGGHWCSGPVPPAPTPPPTTSPPDPPCEDVPGGGKPQDIMMMIDASKSVAQEGWAAEASFANKLIAEVMSAGNPNQHQLNVQWFNADTKPIGASGGANSEGQFTAALSPVADALAAVDYANIRDGATDHPQVYSTTEAAFQSSASGQKSGNDKVLVLITDGETHKGLGCGTLDLGTVEAKIGKCRSDPSHVCSAKGCDEQCMCGVYHSFLFKEKGYKLIVVAIANQNHIGETEAGILNKVMTKTASPGYAFIAKNFEDLEAIVGKVGGKICQLAVA